VGEERGRRDPGRGRATRPRKGWDNELLSSAGCGEHYPSSSINVACATKDPRKEDIPQPKKAVLLLDEAKPPVSEKRVIKKRSLPRYAVFHQDVGPEVREERSIWWNLLWISIWGGVVHLCPATNKRVGKKVGSPPRNPQITARPTPNVDINELWGEGVTD